MRWLVHSNTPGAVTLVVYGLGVLCFGVFAPAWAAHGMPKRRRFANGALAIAAVLVWPVMVLVVLAWLPLDRWLVRTGRIEP